MSRRSAQRIWPCAALSVIRRETADWVVRVWRPALRDSANAKDEKQQENYRLIPAGKHQRADLTVTDIAHPCQKLLPFEIETATDLFKEFRPSQPLCSNELFENATRAVQVGLLRRRRDPATHDSTCGLLFRYEPRKAGDLRFGVQPPVRCRARVRDQLALAIPARDPPLPWVTVHIVTIRGSAAPARIRTAFLGANFPSAPGRADTISESFTSRRWPQTFTRLSRAQPA